MPNETDKTVRQPAMDETQELPAFPARPSQSSGLDKDSLISSQYKALQEAQFLHEETLRQLHGEIQAQKQRIFDIANDQQESAQAPASLDAIYLRLSELERKIGEEASDPLINEIAHRLAALESSGGRGPDRRVEWLSEQIEELRRRASLPHTDPRTDEMALRIASVEGSLRRAQQAFDSEAMTAQIQELQAAARDSSEKAAAELADLRQQLTDAQAQTPPDWSGKFDELEARLAEVSEKSEVEELTARLAQLERAATDDQSAARLEAVAGQVEELAAKLDRAADSSALRELRQKMAELESQISASEPGPLTDALSTRIDQLQDAIEAQSASDAVQALQQRLAALEAQTAQSSDAGEALAELRHRCDALSERLAAISEADAYDSRIAAIESKLDEWPADGSGLQELREQLSAIESSGRADGDVRLAELTARLRALELLAEQSSSSADDGTIDRLSKRLDQLELTGGSSGLPNQIDELRERVAGLTSQLRGGPAPEAITQIDERLALLESSAPTALQRIEKLENLEPISGNDQAEAIAELRQRVDQLVGSGANGAGDSATADILHEIGMRVQALERNGGSEQGASAMALSEELNERIGRLEARTADDGGIPRFELQSIAERLSYLEQAGAASGEAGGPPPQILEQFITRYEAIDGRLALLEESGASHSGGSQSSSETSSALAEIAELRTQLDELQQNGSGPGVSENFLGKLAEKIASGIAGSEVQAIQMQMYAVYFFLALIGALALSSFFMQ